MVVDPVIVACIVVVVESEDGGVHCIINVAATNATHADGASKVLSCSYAKVVVFVDLLEEKEEAGWVMMLLLLSLFVWEKSELVPWLVGGFLQQPSLDLFLGLMATPTMGMMFPNKMACTHV
jgi:hypothetical protein